MNNINNRILCLATLICIVAYTGSMHGSAARRMYSDGMFARAIREQSTAPLYVLVTVENQRDGSLRGVCLLAPSLLDALAIENRISYDAASQPALRKLALSRANHRFPFSSHEALKEVLPDYTAMQLAETRSRFGSLSTEELRRQISQPDSILHGFYRKRGRDAYQAAVAHVCLENGLLVGVADRTGKLFVP